MNTKSTSPGTLSSFWVSQQEQIQALSAHLIAQTLPKPKARPKAKAATCADVQAECSAPVELAQIQDRIFTL
jgi:hypothetical protein